MNEFIFDHEKAKKMFSKLSKQKVKLAIKFQNYFVTTNVVQEVKKYTISTPNTTSI